MLFVAITLLTLLIVLLVLVLLEERRQRRRRAPVGTVNHIWGPNKKRRKNPRVPTVLVAQYTLLEETTDEVPSKIWNISEGGVALLVTEKLPSGTPISLTIEHPDSSELIALQGYVAWSKPLARHDAEGRRLFESGIAFTEKQPVEQQKLDQLLELLRARST